MEILKLTEHEDGSATLEVELTDEECDVFFRAGVQDLVSALWDVWTLERKPSKDANRIDVDDETFKAVINHGILTMLKRAVKEETE